MDGEKRPSEGRRLSALAVREAIRVLNTSHYVVRLIPVVPGDAPVISRTYNRQAIVSAVGFLRHANFGYLEADGGRHDGYHVFFRPDCNHFVFVDDVCEDDIDLMTADGIRPTMIVKTSEGNFQAWVQLANKSDQVSVDEATICRGILAERYGGDTGATGRDQLGRLPGFFNRKPQYESGVGQFPLVTIKRSRFTSCTARLLDDARVALLANPPSPSLALGRVKTNLPNTNDDDLPIELYDRGQHVITMSAQYKFGSITTAYDQALNEMRHNGYKPSLRKFGKGVDRSKQDVAIARYLISNCLSEQIIIETLLHGSEKASERGVEYVEATVRAAYSSS